MRLLPLLGGLLLLTAVPSRAAAPPAAEPRGMVREVAEPRGLLLAQAIPDGDRLAGFEARLQRLEGELRRLTGRLEELEYRQRRLEEAAASAAAPPSATGEPPVAAAPAGEDAAEGPSPPAPAGTAAGEPPPVEPDEAARRGYVLGTIPRDALEKRPGTPAAEGREAAAGASPEDRYRAALALLETGDFDAAEKAFSRFLEDHPDHPKAANAAFWLGETYFFRQDYATAAAVYARNYRTYGPEAPRAPDTLLKLGMALAAIGDRERACQTFGELDRRYPRAPAPVRQALERERAAIGCG